MDPAQGQEVMMVLVTEQLFHILHVTVVRTGGLLGDDHMGQHKLIVCLQDNETQIPVCPLTHGISRWHRIPQLRNVLNEMTHSFSMGAEASDKSEKESNAQM